MTVITKEAFTKKNAIFEKSILGFFCDSTCNKERGNNHFKHSFLFQ